MCLNLSKRLDPIDIPVSWRQADATLQQSLVLCLENRVQTTENLMKMMLGKSIGWFWAMNGGTG